MRILIDPPNSSSASPRSRLTATERVLTCELGFALLQSGIAEDLAGKLRALLRARLLHTFYIRKKAIGQVSL